ncbi:MAG: hypothetical protein ACC682_03735 [Gemmatimonadota bacterium]
MWETPRSVGLTRGIGALPRGEDGTGVDVRGMIRHVQGFFVKKPSEIHELSTVLTKTPGL